MSFAEWKKRSKLYKNYFERAQRQGIGLTECCQAAYKAGERQGRKDVEEQVLRAADLSALINCNRYHYGDEK